MLIQKVFSDMEKELRESFEGLDMYFGYHDDDYENISAFLTYQILLSITLGQS